MMHLTYERLHIYADSCQFWPIEHGARASGRDLTLECGPEVSLKSGRKCKSNSLESVQGHRPAPRIEPVEYATPLEVFDQENGVLATGPGELSINPPGQFRQEIVSNSFCLSPPIQRLNIS